MEGLPVPFSLRLLLEGVIVPILGRQVSYRSSRVSFPVRHSKRTRGTVPGHVVSAMY